MTPENYQRIGQLFDEALERAPAERAEWLRQACGADDELHDAVEQLLAHHSEADTFLARPALEIAAAQTPTLFGQQLGHYRIISLLGAGGMGEVYLAEDATLHRKIALKVLPAYIAQDPERLRRFKQEALAASALNHPNIVTIHEFGTEGAAHFIVTELVEGETLRERLRHGPLALNEALDLAQQIATALHAAHEAGIIHRDIKPENVMIRRDGLVKVLDFGLAKITDTQPNLSAQSNLSTSQSTEAGTVMGTVAYMSPEQARGQKVDARSDLWSLGVVIYEMLTGKRPFQGESAPDLFVAILERQPAPLTQPAATLEPLLNRLLAKDREVRYPSSAELAAELKQLRQQLELSAAHSSKPAFGTDSLAATLFLQSPAQTAEPFAERKTQLKQVQTTAPTSFGSTSPGLPPSHADARLQARPRKVRYAIIALALFALVTAAAYLWLRAPASSGPIDSIAVLPFQNLSGNNDLTYLSDGLSQGLIDRLSELPQLKVISRNSSFKFRGENIDLRSIAAKLGVRAVITGSVRQVGDNLVIRFDLVDADDRQIAGRDYERKSGKIIGLHNEIAQEASAKLRLQLTDSQSKRFGNVGTENADAYRYYLNGLVELNGPQDVRGKALDYFEQAISHDPEFAAAHAEIAYIYWMRISASDNPHELMPKTKAAISRALSIDPNQAKAHALTAMVNECEFDFPGAEKEYLRAIELSPNLDFARNNYAYFLSIMDRPTEALAELEQQSIRDPINRRDALIVKGSILVQARKFDDALQAYKEAQALETVNGVPDVTLGYAYAGKGRYDLAAEHYKKAVDLVGGEKKYSWNLVYLMATYAKIPERRNEARTILKQIEAMSGYTSPALMAAVYTALDDNDKAMSLLEQAYLSRDPLLRYVGTGYEYDGLRATPRFTALTKKIGLSK